MKNKKRGVALLSAIIIMSVVILFSLLIYTLIIGSSLANTYQKNKTDKLVLINKIYADFIDNAGVINEQYELPVEVVNGEQNIKALIVKKNNGSDLDLYFLAVFDFGNQKVLAKQNENFEITKKIDEGKEFYFLADIVKYKEV